MSEKTEDEEKVALDRAEEVLHVQDQQGAGAPGIEPAVTELTPPEKSPWASARTANVLFAVAAAGLILIVVAFFWPAFEDAAKKGGEVVRSSGILLRQIEFLVDSEPDGASVVVDGHLRGQTPALLTVECQSGSDMIVEVQKPGYAPERRPVPCNDRPLKLKVQLRKR